jgi:predicted permease
LEKTVGLLLIIGLGFVLQRKIKSSEQLKGVKTLILSVALPATIFAALLNVKVDMDMLWLPFIGLLINLVLLLVFYLVFKYVTPIEEDKNRTLLMLMPSLAPGLSCLPFISEYLGPDSLAMAALADIGNKIFVLILLYMLAMSWYYRRQGLGARVDRNRLKELFFSLVKEPINLVIVAAFLLLALGFNIQTLPVVVSSLVLRLSAIMGPLVLLFIGMAVKIKKDDAQLILRMLSLRSGVAFLLCAILISVIPNLSTVMILLLLVFAQSSTSFWPYAHILSINELEGDTIDNTFNGGLGLSVMALSLPFSTFIILGIFSFPSIVISPLYPVAFGSVLVGVFLFTPVVHWLKNQKAIKRQSLEVSQID